MDGKDALSEFMRVGNEAHTDAEFRHIKGTKHTATIFRRRSLIDDFHFQVESLQFQHFVLSPSRSAIGLWGIIGHEALGSCRKVEQMYACMYLPRCIVVGMEDDGIGEPAVGAVAECDERPFRKLAASLWLHRIACPS